MIIFTEYRDTQRWLYERLLTAGYPPGRLALLYGGQDEQDREHVKNVFTADPALDDVRVLIATDAASERINLQATLMRPEPSRLGSVRTVAGSAASASVRTTSGSGGCPSLWSSETPGGLKSLPGR